MKKFLPVSFLLIASCRFLDFGGHDEKAFEFRLGWDRGVNIPGKPDPNSPGGHYDKDGNYVPDNPDVVATYTFPEIVAGIYGTLKDPRFTPGVGFELFEVKVPYARWFSGQVFAGNQLAGAYLGKRWTSIVELTTGVFFARDFEDDDWTYGIGATITKF